MAWTRQIAGLVHDDVSWISPAFAEVECGNPSRNARRDVHDGAAGKVDGSHGAQIEEEAVCGPHPVADRAVDEQAPEGDEDRIALEVHPLGEGAGNQRRRDDGELALEHGEDILGNLGGHDGVIDALQLENICCPSRQNRQGCRVRS